MSISKFLCEKGVNLQVPRNFNNNNLKTGLDGLLNCSYTARRLR
jgi:hypothetical protein